jgi:hypothetical protein
VGKTLFADCMLAMGIIGLFAALAMVIAGFIVLTGVIGVAIVAILFVRQKRRERRDAQ